jgi:hypothetical protein
MRQAYGLQDVFRSSFVSCHCPLVSFSLPSSPGSFRNTPLDNPETEQRIIKLLGEMTLQEKIGQLVHFADSSTGPGAPHPDYREQIVQGNVGSLENITGAAETNALQKLSIEKSRLHIPLVFALDVIHGYRTIFPVPLAMASTWDPSMIDRASRIAAREATGEGIRWTFSPMVDIVRDARWGRIVEGAGEDPYLGSAMLPHMCAAIKALVSTILSRCWLVSSTSSAMAPRKGARITTQLNYPSALCVKFNSRPSTLLSKRARDHS